jgi:transcription elongation factor/antiterminator RfaH
LSDAHQLALTADVGAGTAARWYAVQIRANREAGAALQLRAQKFTTFLPQVDKTVRHARQLRTVRAPLFPGYLFVSLDLDRDRWRSINGTSGVIRLIAAQERPAPVPVGVIEAMLAAHTAGPTPLSDGLGLAQKVEILDGPFAQMVGHLNRLDGANRVRVLLDLMGGQVPVLIDRSDLRAA